MDYTAGGGFAPFLERVSQPAQAPATDPAYWAALNARAQTNPTQKVASPGFMALTSAAGLPLPPGYVAPPEQPAPAPAAKAPDVDSTAPVTGQVMGALTDMTSPAAYAQLMESLRRDQKFSQILNTFDGQVGNSFLAGGGGGGMSVQGNPQDFFKMDVLDEILEKFSFGGPTGQVEAASDIQLDTKIDTADPRNDGFVRYDKDGKPVSGKEHFKQWFKDPRVLSAVIGAIGAMAAGVKPGDALLWGAVGGAKAEEMLAAQQKEQIAAKSATNEARAKKNTVAIEAYKAKQQGLEANVKKFTAEKDAAISKYTAGSEVFKNIAEGRASLIKQQVEAGTYGLNYAKYLLDEDLGLMKEARERHALKVNALLAQNMTLTEAEKRAGGPEAVHEEYMKLKTQRMTGKNVFDTPDAAAEKDVKRMEMLINTYLGDAKKRKENREYLERRYLSENSDISKAQYDYLISTFDAIDADNK